MGRWIRIGSDLQIRLGEDGTPAHTSRSGMQRPEAIDMVREWVDSEPKTEDLKPVEQWLAAAETEQLIQAAVNATVDLSERRNQPMTPERARDAILGAGGGEDAKEEGTAARGIVGPEREAAERPTVAFGTVWKRIEAHAGEEFQQIRGKVFTYSVAGGCVKPSTVNQQISMSEFERAFYLCPLPDTTPVQHLRGPAFIYAILMDRRIRQENW